MCLSAYSRFFFFQVEAKFTESIEYRVWNLLNAVFFFFFSAAFMLGQPQCLLECTQQNVLSRLP